MVEIEGRTRWMRPVYRCPVCQFTAYKLDEGDLWFRFLPGWSTDPDPYWD